MRAAITNNGLTLRVIAGTHSAILAIDLQENKRKGCLGFSLLRTDLGPVGKPLPAAKQTSRWLPNMLRFPTDKSSRWPLSGTSDRVAVFRKGFANLCSRFIDSIAVHGSINAKWA